MAPPATINLYRYLFIAIDICEIYQLTKSQALAIVDLELFVRRT